MKKFIKLLCVFMFVFAFGGLVACSTDSEIDENSLSEQVVVDILQSSVTIDVFEQTELSVYVKNTDEKLVWESSDTSVAIIDEQGKLFTKQQGTTTITAKIGDISDSCFINVVSSGTVPVLHLNDTEVDIFLGGKFLIEPIITYKGKVAEGATVQYEILSGNDLITLTDGLVTGTAYGTAIIKLSAEWNNVESISMQETLSVTVKPLITSIVEQREFTLYTAEELGGINYQKSAMLNAKVYENGSEKTVEWYIEEGSDIVTLDGSVVTAVEEGEAKLKYSCQVGDGTYFEGFVNVSVKIPSIEHPQTLYVPRYNGIIIDKTANEGKGSYEWKNSAYDFTTMIFGDNNNKAVVKVRDISSGEVISNADGTVNISQFPASYDNQVQWAIYSNEYVVNANVVIVDHIISTEEEFTLYRVSTKGQVDKNDIPMQKNACRTFVDKMDDWQLCKEFYEKGVSGFKVSAEKRDAIQDLKLAAENNEFDILLVFMFDRLGRIPNETPFVLEWFDSHNIEMWSVKEGQQRFENDGDYLMNYIRFWQAGGESKKTSIRVKERLSQLVEEGAFTGGCCPYGYRFIKSGVVNKKGKELVALEIVPEEAALISFIFNKTVKEGYGTWRLCKIINEKGYRTHNGAKFQSNTVNRILKNYVYAGYFLRNGKLSPHIPQLQIVDKQLIDEAQIILKSRSNKMSERNNIAYTTRGAALLSGNIYCAHCGTRMHAVTYSNPVILADGTRKVYKGIKYICPNRARNRGDCDGQTHYSSTEIDKTVLYLVDEVLNGIKGKPKDKAIKIKYNKTVEQKKNEYNRVIKAYEKQQEIVKKLLEEVGKVLIGESIFDINTLNESLKIQKDKLAMLEEKIPITLQELNNEKEMLDNIDYLYDEFISWSEEFNLATKERKKMIICKLFKSIKIGKGYNVDITLNLDYEQFLNGIKNEEPIAI